MTVAYVAREQFSEIIVSVVRFSSGGTRNRHARAMRAVHHVPGRNGIDRVVLRAGPVSVLSIEVGRLTRACTFCPRLFEPQSNRRSIGYERTKRDYRFSIIDAISNKSVRFVKSIRRYYRKHGNFGNLKTSKREIFSRAFRF